MNAKIDLTGQRFGSLTVIEYSPRKTTYGGTHWKCQCDCGNHLIVRSDNLRKGNSTQCSECRGNAGRKAVYVKEVMNVDS